jgi:hypothetical protein
LNVARRRRKVEEWRRRNLQDKIGRPNQEEQESRKSDGRDKLIQACHAESFDFFDFRAIKPFIASADDRFR